MTLFICISDYWQNKYFYKITPPKIHTIKGSNKTVYSLEILPSIRRDIKLAVVPQVVKRYKYDIDGINFFYFNKELLNFFEYRRFLSMLLQSKGVQLLWLQIVTPEKDVIDWKWNRMLATILWEKIETEYLMSWLSTLGGAFSALGEQYTACAEMAGKISKKQLMIGLKLGDPFLQSRCKLFYSISLIQTGRLRTAKYIIRQEYEFARCHREQDGRLIKMCKGIWIKLQYEYGRRIKARKKTLLLKDETLKKGGNSC